MRSIIVLIIALYSFSNVYAQDSILINSSEVTNDQARNIFKNIVQIDPIKCKSANIDNSDCIVGLAKTESRNVKIITFYKLIRFFGTWTIEIKRNIYEEGYTDVEFFNEIEFTKINKEYFVYFLFGESPEGNAVNSIELKFSLLSLTNQELVSLNYEGEPVYGKNAEFIRIDEGRFLNINTLNSNPKHLKYLKEQANKFIARFSKKENISSTPNFEEKWKKDNPSFDDVWNKKVVKSLKNTYYTDNIFAPFGCNYDSIENSKFKIISIFKGSILGFDKHKRKYFPIYIDGCMHGCEKSIEFIGETLLRIKDWQGVSILVNLLTMTCRREDFPRSAPSKPPVVKKSPESQATIVRKGDILEFSGKLNYVRAYSIGPGPTPDPLIETKFHQFEVVDRDLGRMSYRQAVSECNKIGYQWHLPNKAELQLILKYSSKFKNKPRGVYWTNISVGDDKHIVCVDGACSIATNTSDCNVIAVRNIK